VANKVTRLLFAFFERDGDDSSAGKKWLRGCTQTLADNKGVEELHHACKMDGKHNACKKQSTAHLQHVVQNSGVLEKHGLHHAAQVTKETFRRLWDPKRRKQFIYQRKLHRARHHKLPRKWSGIMGPKAWRTTTESEGRIAASAWHWLQTIGPHQLGPLHHESPGIGIGLSSALFSRLLLPNVVFMCRSTNSYWATLGRGKWGCLAWPLVHEARNDTLCFKFDCRANACADWHHVVNVEEYEVLPCVEAYLDSIVLQQSGAPEPLPKAALRHAGSLSMEDWQF